MIPCTMQTIVEKGLLYDRYGALLTAHQREIYEEAVYHDLSLAEIAERHSVSRQGVSDLLNRVTRTLEDYEKKLGLVGRFEAIDTLCDEIEQACDGDGAPTAARAIRQAAGRIREALG